MKRLSLDRKISRLSLKPPSSTLTTFHPIMMKLPAREGKLLGLVRDKIPSCLFSRVSKGIGLELKSIQSGRFIFTTWYACVFGTKLIFYPLSKINHRWRGPSIQRELEIQFKERGKQLGGKQLESRIGMNYSRYLLGSSDPIDRFLSYFKGAMRFSTK